MEFDIVNAIYATCVVFIFFYIYKIPFVYYWVLLGHLAAVFMTNDFLFPISYMPDQFRYINTSQGIRESLDFLNYYQYDGIHGYGTFSNAALFFAIFPIPFLKSVFSIAIINFMLYSFMFIFLYRKKILVDNGLWFYLFYPSLMLYSAIGGRDTLILVVMILSIYQLSKGNTIFSIILSTPLLFIKFQNFFILILAILIYKGINNSKVFSLKNFFKFSMMLVALVIFLQFFSIYEINILRRNMFLEDGGDLSDYIPINGYFDAIYKGFTGTLYMLLKPLLWESRNILQIIQSVENLIIFYIVYILIKKMRNIHDKFKYFLLIYFFTAMMIYGIVVFNFGTAARYKFPFVLIFILFAMKLIHNNKKNI